MKLLNGKNVGGYFGPVGRKRFLKKIQETYSTTVKSDAFDYIKIKAFPDTVG